MKLRSYCLVVTGVWWLQSQAPLLCLLPVRSFQRWSPSEQATSSQPVTKVVISDLPRKIMKLPSEPFTSSLHGVLLTGYTVSNSEDSEESSGIEDYVTKKKKKR
jgi:hypothetical protein